MWVRTDNGHDVNLRYAVAIYVFKENVTNYTKDGKPFTETYYKVKVRMNNDSLFTLRSFKDPLQAERYRERLVEDLKQEDERFYEHLRLIARCINVEQAIEEGA
jgi:hypothetical protein